MFNKLFKVNDYHEFKPILAEIEESPVSPLGRTTFWILIAIVVFTILWTTLGKVDIVVTSRGKIIPDGSIKVLQPLETGVVKNILVREGDYVKRGQTLMEIDPSVTQPQLQSLKENLNYLELETNRLNAVSDGNSFSLPLLPVNVASAVKTQTELYNSSMSGVSDQIASKKMELKKTDEQIKSAMASRDANKKMLDMNLDKLNRLNEVKDIIARDELQKTEESVESYNAQYKSAQFKLAELNHQKSQIVKEMGYVQQSFRTENLKELSDREKQTNQIKANIAEANFRNKRQNIVSPVDGYVNSLLIHTVGGVVTPAEKLLTVVPKDTPLLIKATVLNTDIGFIKEGMPVSLKIDTFSFQKYGILKGEVKTVSRDSIDDEKLGPVYEVFITPIDKSLMVEGKRQSISTGMSLTAEIKTGKRRIIEFFIYPLIKYLNESINVR